MYLHSRRRRDKLGVGTGGGDQQRGGGKAKQKAASLTESEKTMGKCEKTSHSDSTAPSLSL
jgi:hypothetical protein